MKSTQPKTNASGLTVKPFLLNTVQSEKIKLAKEDDTLITNDEVAMKRNDFFLNAAFNPKTLKFENFDLLPENIGHLTLKAIVKCRKHSSVITKALVFTKECFSFNTITIEDAIKEISMLDSSQAIKATDMPVKVIKRTVIFYRTSMRLFQ